MFCELCDEEVETLTDCAECGAKVCDDCRDGDMCVDCAGQQEVE